MDSEPENQMSNMRVIGVVLVATLCVSIGETLLSAGMKQVGKGGHNGFGFVGAAISDWHVLCGTSLMIVYFSLYSLALSWKDISFVLPITAMSYLVVALLANFCLHETVTPTRWLGALIITLGVVVVGRGG